MKIAIITGASSGLGRGYAESITRFESFDEIWLIARRLERLEALSESLDVKTRCISLDLAAPDSALMLSALLDKEKPLVSLLVNAAGAGRIGRSDEISAGDQNMMISLNAGAVANVTSAVLPYMEKGGRIMQIASASAFLPVPYVNVYAATKAFVLSYSRALGFELRKKGISVTAVCPYWIKDTEFISVAEKGDSTTVGRYPFAITMKRVIASSLVACYRRRSLSTPGAFPTFMHFASKVLPSSWMMGIWNILRKS